MFSVVVALEAGVKVQEEKCMVGRWGLSRGSRNLNQTSNLTSVQVGLEGPIKSILSRVIRPNQSIQFNGLKAYPQSYAILKHFPHPQRSPMPFSSLFLCHLPQSVTQLLLMDMFRREIQ